MKGLFVLFICVVFTLCVVPVAKGDVPAAAEALGGSPEYLFIEKLPEKEAMLMAELLTLAVYEGRAIIFQHVPKINNAELGDKGFTPEYFEAKLMERLKQNVEGLSPAQKRIFNKFIFAAKISVSANQDRINVKGVGFKYFLPATWGRETAMIFKAQTGIIIKQTALLYRYPGNRPDDSEMKSLIKFTSPDYDKKTYGEISTIGKQKVYRYYRPVYMVPGCLGCHGDPKGGKDVLGYEKDGLKVGDVRGVISVAVPVQ